MADKEQEGGGYASLFNLAPSFSITKSHHAQIANKLLAEAISHPPNPTYPAWAQSPTLHPVGRAKPKKASVPQGTSSISILPSITSDRLPSTQADLHFSHSSATKDVTGYVPVVGSVVEGVGNTPVAQKIGGKEEEKGYLGSAYSYAGGALRTVYDAAGNVVCLVHSPQPLPPPPPSLHNIHNLISQTPHRSAPSKKKPAPTCTAPKPPPKPPKKTQPTPPKAKPCKKTKKSSPKTKPRARRRKRPIRRPRPQIAPPTPPRGLLAPSAKPPPTPRIKSKQATGILKIMSKQALKMQ